MSVSRNSSRNNTAKRLITLDHKLEKARVQIRKFQTLRLWTGTVTLLGFLLAAIKPQWHLSVPSLVFFFASFPLLVRATRQWVKFKNGLEVWRNFEQRQEKRRQGQWKAELSDANFEALTKSFDHLGVAADLDLTGPKSLFTQIDETFSLGGAKRLVEWLLKDPSISLINERQKLLKLLSASRWFFIRFRMASPAIIEGENTPKLSGDKLLSEIQAFPEPDLKSTLLFTIMLIAWITSVVLVWQYPVIWVLFVIAHLGYLFKAGPLLGRGEGVLHHFSELAGVFGLLESKRAPKAIIQICTAIQREKPARRIKLFNWTLVGLSIESHPLVYLILNFLFPWSSVFSYILINQVHGVRKFLSECFNELEEVEALTSLVILTTDQTSVFPEFSESATFDGSGLFHPLIDQSKAVANSFKYEAGQKMTLLTGSNMSGKSTFLRTIGINQTLANLGAPVFAKSLKTYPFRIRSCIRVSDSIEQGFSYFYAEVQRLKLVLDHADHQPPVFYMIDEIFRGTNNRERLIGSQAVIKHLLKTPAFGFITTHDLELTIVAEGNSAVKNYHFRDEARDNQMYFSYNLEAGPSPTTNALKIMYQAGLPVEKTT